MSARKPCRCAGERDGTCPVHGGERCFACGRPVTLRGCRCVTADGQRVEVGNNCYKLVRAAGDAGYQPPLGGPRIYLYKGVV